MSIRKRALSLLLVLVMLLGVLPAGAAAAEVYQDVPSGHWASDYIARVAEQGLMVGTSDTTFAPEETITRAMFVTILARYAKAETDNNAETAFADVPAGQYYTGAVAWAAANGIVNGTSAVTFAPNDPVTREQDGSPAVSRHALPWEQVPAGRQARRLLRCLRAFGLGR